MVPEAEVPEVAEAVPIEVDMEAATEVSSSLVVVTIRLTMDFTQVTRDAKI